MMNFLKPSSSVLRTTLGRICVQRNFATGTVKWFNDQKGFGFIQPNEGEGEDDVFVHWSRIATGGNRLVEGDVVDYEVEKDAGTGKSQASNVTGGSGRTQREEGEEGTEEMKM